MTEAPNSPEAAETDYLQLELRHNPGGDTQGYTDGYYVSCFRPPRRSPNGSEGKKGVVLHTRPTKTVPRRSNSTCRRRSSHSPHLQLPGPPLCGPDFLSCRSAPQRRACGRKIRSPEPRPVFRQLLVRPQLRCGQASPGRSEPAPSRPCPGSRSTPAVRPEPASGPPPGALFFARGRRFAENRYLCIMSIVRNTESDLEFENKIRPQELETFSGQDKIVENLHIFIKAALMRGDSLDHVLHGPPGTGQDDLANIIANEMGAQLRVTSGPVLDKPGDLAGLLTNLNPGDVLFIDEIHRLSPIVEEYLYSAMEDYKIDIVLDKGPRPRSIQIELAPLTLIGAPTRSGLLTSPPRGAFRHPVPPRILRRPGARGHRATLGAHPRRLDRRRRGPRSGLCVRRGTPRIANALLPRARLRDGQGRRAHRPRNHPHRLAALNIDSRGLDQMDNKILGTIIEKFNGGPVGLEHCGHGRGRRGRDDRGGLRAVPGSRRASSNARPAAARRRRWPTSTRIHPPARRRGFALLTAGELPTRPEHLGRHFDKRPSAISACISASAANTASPTASAVSYTFYAGSCRLPGIQSPTRTRTGVNGGRRFYF